MVMVVDPTSSGKTELGLKILLSDKVFLQPPARIKYHYRAWQNRFAEAEAADPRLEFVEDSQSLMTYQVGVSTLLWLLMTRWMR